MSMLFGLLLFGEPAANKGVIIVGKLIVLTGSFMFGKSVKNNRYCNILWCEHSVPSKK